MSLLVFLIVLSVPGCFSNIPRPRGVAISMASLYKEGNTFRCLDGSKEFPFDYVNDDYCDCPDGSDEPGTSACPNGKFHCTNAGYRPSNVLSSRVNDGVCDCCDGTDEWAGSIQCVNNCKELGKKMREEADRVRLLQEEGYKTKLRYMEEGKKKQEEKKTEVAELEKKKAELEALKTEMETKKNEAETPEKEAKDKHEQAWNEELEKRKAEKERIKAEIAFIDLDANGDKIVDLMEIKANPAFDIDSNGEVSDEEAKEHLEGQETADSDHFTLKVWPNIKELYKPKEEEEPAKGDQAVDNEQTADNAARPVIMLKVLGDDGRPRLIKSEVPNVEGQLDPTPKSASSHDYPLPDDDDESLDEDEDEDEYADEEEEEEPENNTVNTEAAEGENEEEKMPDYDEATKQLIAVADEARKQFNEAEANLRDAENRIRDLNNYLTLDLGPNFEFSELKGNCYEYTDREYTYKLCAFDRATQRPKNGGGETSLGNWGKWYGSGEDKYAAQMYENGQNCWNGPNRSVKVNMKCGLENKVTNAFEPSRCEYEFDFETPSRCTEPRRNPEEHIHTEL